MRETIKQKVMILAAHPDDELIGCGGSLAKHYKQTNSVKVIYATSGEAGNLQYPKEKLGQIREQEAIAGLKILNCHNYQFLRQPDGNLQASYENLIKLTQIIRTDKPNLIYLPHSNEAHQDHCILHKLGLQAINKARGQWFPEAIGEPHEVQTILSYEVYPLQQKINYLEDISDYMQLKLKALQEHKSQLQTVPYDDLAKSINRYRGIMNTGTQFAEGFQIIKASNLFDSLTVPSTTKS